MIRVTVSIKLCGSYTFKTTRKVYCVAFMSLDFREGQCFGGLGACMSTYIYCKNE